MNQEKVFIMFKEVLVELSKYITSNENNYVLQMAITNSDELQAYRATRLSPTDVMDLKKEHDRLWSELCIERDRDLVQEVQQLKWKLDETEEILSIIKNALGR